MTASVSLAPTALATTPSFGFGDRLGLATPGHLASLQQDGGDIAGIFAQQSIREMARTQRTATQVMTAAVDALAAEQYDQPWGADADHLKTPDDVDITAAAGFAFFTIDPSDHVDQRADTYDAATVAAKYTPTAWVDAYLGKTIAVPDGPTLSFDEETLQLCAVKYGKAIEHARTLAAHIRQTAAKLNQPYEIEVSVDETDQPTTLAEHYIVAEQLIRGHADLPGIDLGDTLISLAPRFIGELEKGVDYIGSVDRLAASLKDHATIANHLGPYKLSLHSGSDKLSMYAALGRATSGRFHVKTAGTSYLEALRVVAIHDPALFRRVVTFSRDRYEVDKATYHVHATLGSAPPENEVAEDHALVAHYLEHWADVPEGVGFTKAGRQILHCTFGSVMTDADLAPTIRQVLTEHADTYRDVLVDHFGRHLRALRSG
ncbi:MAG: tagaturonate epimerase family protein [Planctomycetota bacterium]